MNGRAARETQPPPCPPTNEKRPLHERGASDLVYVTINVARLCDPFAMLLPRLRSPTFPPLRPVAQTLVAMEQTRSEPSNEGFRGFTPSGGMSILMQPLPFRRANATRGERPSNRRRLHMSDILLRPIIAMQVAVHQLREREDGQTTTEYAILLGFLAIAIIIALFFLRGVLRSLFSSAASSVSRAPN